MLLAIPTTTTFNNNIKSDWRRSKNYQRMCCLPLLACLLLLLLAMVEGRGEGNCPSVCVCKWKNGKETVECNNQALITIPEDIDPSTQVLDLSNNNLQILPSETFIRTNLINLQKIYLRNCRLGQIDEQAFKGLTNLVDLDLSHNLLTSIPSFALKEIPSLRDLTLASNPIQKVESQAFRYVPSLVKLDLSNCDIQMIAPQALEGLELLHALKLNHNKLSELRPRTVETLSKLHGVELHDNPWLCDCRLRAAKIWLTDNNIPYPVAPMCSGGPERVIDRTFAELHVDDFACKPEMLPMRRYIEASSGDNASIICRTGAVPSANINWYWNGRLLANNSIFSSYQKVYIYEDGNFEKRSKLVLTNSQETDSSEFYCVADNRAGTAEANFTLHVAPRKAGISTLGNGQIVGLSAALVIIILFILLIILFLLVRLRKIPTTETKTPGQMEIMTSVSPSNNLNGKVCTSPTNENNSADRKAATNDMNLANPVQKPPRLTDINYTTSHYNGNGSIIATGTCFLSPTASAGNNPDLINDTKISNSGTDLTGLIVETASTTTTLTSNSLLNTSNFHKMDRLERSGSGEYSRAGCDSLYPSGLWESAHSQNTNALLEEARDFYLKRTKSTTINAYNDFSSDQMSNTTTSNIMNMDDETPTSNQFDYLSRTFPRTHLTNNSVSLTASPDPHHMLGGNKNNNSGSAGGGVGGYPSDYGLPLVPGAEQQQHHQQKIQNTLPPTHFSHTLNAKTMRVWQKGGVPVLPPVTALKRALTNSRNSPDEGYQEGCGTDV
jgi:kekkon-1